MIVYDLECSQGHIFEGWFENYQSFEVQDAKNMINCPYCDDTNIKKVLSPVAMKSSSSHGEKVDTGSIDYKRLAKEIMDHINDDFDDTGSDFAKEALKMHYGVAEKRNIKGSATATEEKMLTEEGVQFFRIPVFKDDSGNDN